MKIAAIGRIAALASLTVLASGAAHAVYRCGNVFQDRPCDDGGAPARSNPGKAASPPAPATPAARPVLQPAAPATAQSPFAAACARVGQAAQQMAWKREGGATQDVQLSDLPAAGSREEMTRTLDSVYRKRGSAPAIRAAIEAECVAEKQQAADTAEAIRVLQAQQAGTKATAASAPAATAHPASEDAARKQPPSDAGPSPSCPGWRSQLTTINDEFRRGGNAAAMEQLQSRRRGVEKQMREGRC